MTWPPPWLAEAPPIAPEPPADTAPGFNRDNVTVEPPEAIPPDPAYGTWRHPACLGRWPIPWRQRWADRAGELEDAGLDWREAERRAFAEVAAEVDPAALTEATP